MPQAIAPDTSRATRIRLYGTVQGLGIRPSIARLACQLGLCGSVRNELSGVSVNLEGSSQRIAQFKEQLAGSLPDDCRVNRITEDEIENVGRTVFVIEPSESSGTVIANVPLDRVVCDACLAEVRGRDSRRAGYPFTSCAECGPRYSIIESMPYDRARTSMSRFVMCDPCRSEYVSASDRRFHAQTNCCPNCGPRLWSTSPRDSVVHEHEEAILAAVRTLVRGGILALKGIGGYQLLCDATNDSAVRRLRDRKGRPSKPLAVMIDGIDAAASLADLADLDKRELMSPAGPIVIVRCRSGSRIADSIHPRLGDVGLMLPTTPLHAMILDSVRVPLVVTSGNIEGEPIEYQVTDAEQHLATVADCFLHHDRDIVRPIDDSVVRPMFDRSVTIRAARGLAPMAVNIPTIQPTLAVGGQQKAALTLSNSHQCILGPHLGELSSIANRQRFDEQVRMVQELYGIEPDSLARDAHPDYFSSQWAERQKPDCISTQHHHAHVVAAMVEHGWLDQTVVGVAFDGTGLGTDGTIWGGEFLLATAGQFKRVGHLRPFAMSGGERAIREPSRIATALIDDATESDTMRLLGQCGIKDNNSSNILRMLRDRSFSPLTSSVGRLFDGVAAIVLGESRSTYEGEPAMHLESACDPAHHEAYDFSVTNDAPAQIDWRPMIRQLLRDRIAGVDQGAMAMRFHRGLARAVFDLVQSFPGYHVVLSGGVFQNRVLLELLAQSLKDSGRVVGLPGRVPTNDGGLSVGQLAIATEKKGTLIMGGKTPCA